jgi:signal transduction histidine kinase
MEGRRDAVYIDARLWTAVAEEVTHRLRNALGIIVQEAENLQAAYRERVPEVAEGFDPYTERIAERVEALRRETIDILSIHDVEALTLTRSDLSGVVRDAQGALERDRPRRAALRYELEGGLPAVLMDRDRVRAALENLVSNAFRAISGGGVVTVSTRSVSNLQRARIGHGPADYVVLEVNDDGIGIPAANLRYLFEPGFTTKKYGTGFGLAFVQRVAAHHGGFVEVTSEEGRGSTFSVYLPVVDNEHA